VITNIPGIPTGGDANARAYTSFPRKYNPLMKLNNSPNGSPSLRNRRASMNRAFSLMIILARTPPAFAGESRKIRCGAGPFDSRDGFWRFEFVGAAGCVVGIFAGDEALC
jgi:hypothetical protein